MVNSNATHSSSLGKAQLELKSLLQEAMAVFGCFFVMLVLTDGKPPGWMIPVTFLVTSGFVFWAECKKEKSSVQPVKEQPDGLATSSEPSQEVPIHFLQQGQSKYWNAWMNANFPGDVNLNGPDLSNANLNGANLSNTNLRWANLDRADLSNATLIEADLSNADLIQADLSNARLMEANLMGANLDNAILRGVDLSNANLNNANLSDAFLLRVILFNADLSNANLREANLSEANLDRANLNGANLSDAMLRGANLSGANVKKAQFGKAIGISESEKLDLIKRGAIFDESPGDREFTLKK